MYYHHRQEPPAGALRGPPGQRAATPRPHLAGPLLLVFSI